MSVADYTSNAQNLEASIKQLKHDIWRLSADVFSGIRADFADRIIADQQVVIAALLDALKVSEEAIDDRDSEIRSLDGEVEKLETQLEQVRQAKRAIKKVWEELGD